MSMHPATGPISPEEMRALAEAPMGQATLALRKHDPAWGLTTPENPTVKWSILLKGTAVAYATVEVEAASEADARRYALKNRPKDRDWTADVYEGIEDIEVEEVGVIGAGRK